MKKVLYTATLAVLTLAVGCTKEKEDTDLTTDIVGTYYGTYEEFIPMTLVVTKENDKSVTLNLSFSQIYGNIIYDSTALTSKTSFTISDFSVVSASDSWVTTGSGTLSENKISISTHRKIYKNGVFNGEKNVIYNLTK